MSSPSFPRPLLLLAGALLLSGCVDRLPSAAEKGPAAPAVPPRLHARLRCDVQVAAGEVRCAPAERAPAGSGAPRAVIFPNGTGQVMASGVSAGYDSVTGIHTLDMDVRNWMTRPLGTTDGVTPHADGVRVFLWWGPYPSEVTLANPDGVGTFTASDQPYFQYDEVIGSGQASAPRPWRFIRPPSVTSFSFGVEVSAEVPYPDGWVEAYPVGAGPLRVGATIALSALVRDASGTVVTGESVAWSSSDASVATVDSAGVLRATGPGVADVFAATAGRPSGSGARFYVTPSAPFASVSGGGSHACALDTGGQAYCWGYQATGRLGVGPVSGTYRVPTAVRHPAGVAFTRIAAGGAHGCALDAAGQAYCWGHNAEGRLGDGTTTTRNQPVAVQHPAGVAFTEVTLGVEHTCALTPGGQAYCWGGNASGQVGDGTTTHRAVPAAVQQPFGVAFATLRAGGHHTCGATAAGTVWCWGNNAYGQLGDSTTTTRTAPVQAKHPGGVALPGLAAGRTHTCGVSFGGQAWCWGRNGSGRLGDNTVTTRTTPVAVQQGALLFASLTGGEHHTCGLTTGGAVHCWGASSNGQVGDGTLATRRTPVAVQLPAGAAFTAVSAGSVFTCAVRGGGQGYCWGDNAYGQAGDSTTVDRPAPVPSWH